MLKSILGSVPGVGAAITELVEVVIPKSALERLVDFTIDLSIDLTRLKDRVNLEYLTKEEAAFMFREVLNSVLNDYHKEKVDSLRAIFLNAVTDSSRTSDVKELYLNIAKNLAASHILLLKLLQDPKGMVSQRGIKYDLEAPGALIQVLKKCLPEFTEDQITAVWHDLRNYNMLTTESSSLRAMISHTRLEQLDNRLTSFGQDFVAFLKVP